MNTTAQRSRNGSYFLCDFDPLSAPLVATWARDPSELFWLAPSTPPPLTAAKVMNWLNPGVSALLLCRDTMTVPLGYLELNLMPAQKTQFWLGHCVIRPDQRGCGLGKLMIDLALAEAFTRQQADSVSLVVFPDNMAALSCYRSVGFVIVGDQFKDFWTTGRTHRMLRMRISRDEYARREPAPPLPA
jgi:ribosomal protein S18 acetylase RimI-like enzyme